MSKWIQKTKMKKGKFDEYCKRKGYSGATNECIKEAIKSKDKTVRKRANLAKTLKKLRKKKK